MRDQKAGAVRAACARTASFLIETPQASPWCLGRKTANWPSAVAMNASDLTSSELARFLQHLLFSEQAAGDVQVRQSPLGCHEEAASSASASRGPSAGRGSEGCHGVVQKCEPRRSRGCQSITAGRGWLLCCRQQRSHACSARLGPNPWSAALHLGGLWHRRETAARCCSLLCCRVCNAEGKIDLDVQSRKGAFAHTSKVHEQ